MLCKEYSNYSTKKVVEKGFEIIRMFTRRKLSDIKVNIKLLITVKIIVINANKRMPYKCRLIKHLSDPIRIDFFYPFLAPMSK